MTTSQKTTKPDSPGREAGNDGTTKPLPRALRGYDRTATDALVGELRAQVTRLEAEVALHQKQEQLVGKTLLTATSHATAIKDAARREAEQVLRKSRTELERRTALAAQAERDRAAAERELVRLRQLAQEMHQSLETFLTQSLDKLRPEPSVASPAADTTPAEAGTATGEAKESLGQALEDTLKRETADAQSRSGSGFFRQRS